MAIVNLTDTWILENYAEVFEASNVGDKKQSPPLAALAHAVAPGLTWRAELYPRGDSGTMNSASAYVRAFFGSEKESVSSVWAKLTVTVVTGAAVADLRNLENEVDVYWKDGWRVFGSSNAFRQDALKAAALSKLGHLEMKLDLSIYKIVDLLQCRATVRALLWRKEHTDVTGRVEGTIFKAHKAILAQRCTAFSEAVPVGTTADAATAFLGAVYWDRFDFLANWEKALGVLRLSVAFGSADLREFCDHALARLVPTLDFPILLRILPEAIQLNASATKFACIQILSETKEILTSADWTAFKGTAGLHVFQAICDALLEKTTSGVLPTQVVHRAPEVTLSHTWKIPHAALLSAAALESTSVTSLPFLAHQAFPGFTWQLEFYPRGNAMDSRYRPGFASIYLKAVFDPARETVKGVYAKWKADIIVSDRWQKSFPDTAAFNLYSGAKEKFGYVNAFPTEILNKALGPRKASLAIQLDLTVASVPELLKCRDLFSSLYTDKTHADIDIDVHGTIFRAHKFILASRTSLFGLTGFGLKLDKFEIDDATPQAFEAFMAGVYYANWDFLSDMDLTIAVLKLAVRWRVDDLHRYCDEAWARFVNASNVSQILYLAATEGVVATTAACVELLFANEEMIKSGGWQQFKHYADVKLHVVGGDNVDFEASKSFLSARSAVFALMLDADTEENRNGKVEIKDTTSEAFELFLAGVYYDWSYLSTMEQTISVLGLAERFGVADLKRSCDEALAHRADEWNVFELLPHAVKYNAEVTTTTCVQILFANKDLMKSDDWIEFKEDANNKDIMALIAEAFWANSIARSAIANAN